MLDISEMRINTGSGVDVEGLYHEI